MSQQTWAEYRAQRLASDWLHKGPDARKHRKNLCTDQIWYAATLRRQLAEQLAEQANEKVKAPETQNRSFWVSVANACRREVSRCYRLNNMLAQSRKKTAAV